jgi:hypothetical protein
MGPWQWLVAYLLKFRGLVASGWPPCLQALAAKVILIREADNLTLAQDINVKVPQAVVALMSGQDTPPTWIQSSNSLQMEIALFKEDSEKPGLQSPLLTTSYWQKPYHKDGLHNELNFGHWFRHYDMQRQSK